MTRAQAVAVVLIATGLVYALLYAAWLRKRRRHTSAAVVVVEGTGGPGTGGPGTGGPGTGDRASRQPGDELRAEGTYVSTTTAASRHERVVVGGLGNRARATMLVRRGASDQLVRFERQGESAVVIPRSRLVDVRRERGMAGKVVGTNRLLVLRWRADDGSLYETGFLPRYRIDLDRIESALWWHQGGAEVTDPTTTAAEGDPHP